MGQVESRFHACRRSIIDPERQSNPTAETRSCQSSGFLTGKQTRPIEKAALLCADAVEPFTGYSCALNQMPKHPMKRTARRSIWCGMVDWYAEPVLKQCMKC
jgi:hypothetical protein